MPIAARGLVLIAALAIPIAVSPAAAAERHAIVVLGASVADDGRPSAALERRLETALAAARRDPAALVVVTGGVVSSSIAEGPAMAAWLKARGIAEARLRVEDRARHTGENADLVVPILQREGITRVTLVTDRYHLSRAVYHLRAALRERGLARSIAVTGSGAPDNLRGRALARALLAERVKQVRDARLRRSSAVSPAAARPRPARIRGR
jgi:uncharacterized SAM-binding protein YcdF (DUF218 family)